MLLAEQNSADVARATSCRSSSTRGRASEGRARVFSPRERAWGGAPSELTCACLSFENIGRPKSVARQVLVVLVKGDFVGDAAIKEAPILPLPSRASQPQRS